ncbi:hypothetical protein ASAP_2192 [Asaia bogorensis]|uniref:Uncharacterized protein n=1 Tax=Asaia bogorensis TaxID=91915 RepID=A0A060QLD4_9PROT|nr:hypothetical protein ASAP_2192 [Asaia bogorensis]
MSRKASTEFLAVSGTESVESQTKRPAPEGEPAFSVTGMPDQ